MKSGDQMAFGEVMGLWSECVNQIYVLETSSLNSYADDIWGRWKIIKVR